MELQVTRAMSLRNEPAERLARHFGIKYSISTQEDDSKIVLYLRVMNSMTLDSIKEKLPLVYTRNLYKESGDYNERMGRLLDYLIDNKEISLSSLTDPHFFNVVAKQKIEHLFHILPDYTLAQFEQLQW